ncbi:LamG-like jellyroll fold domain-containing protein [Jidongwangia harbinensis]|uniref:LamG-like jellyroll fold domain-containing protein n=1 Tax=Jidongwangia harbinensis TaxID=2878561 RepID=UPI001CDA1C0E|nr:LamG-like jellyroll fold domain-containing protein [Jidongwangia harbinensis]MCA2218143.1 metallophosphoesterase [Jidongwangia harbinensis]
MERRNLLKAAAAAPAVPLLGSAPAQAAARGKAGDRFALAVLPDTQYLFDADSADPAPLRETFRYLLEERSVVFMTHLGDVTEHGTADELALAGETFRKLDGRLPYSVLAGNHDVPGGTDERGASPYLKVFGPSRFAGLPTFAGASPDGYNTAHLFSGGGRRWLVLALDWRSSDAGLAWAQTVIDRHPRVPVIVTTHDLAYADDTGAAALSAHGQRLWDRLIRDNDQVFLTLNGHYWPPGRTTLTNAAGHDVHVHITNYQDRYYGGAGMIRLYTFDLARNTIDVETFAPWFLSRDPAARTPLEAEHLELTGPTDRFSLAIDFDARFAGFDPVVIPAPRPARSVIDRHTAAYWRFDTAGQAVTDGAAVRDLTGKGNDLTVRRLPGSPADVLTMSAEHHPGQPAHASLRFDGGKGPDRGAILHTGPDAALNSMTFTDGYTIEAFLKLPDPFVGDHAWMGILSWEGRSGDAGKTSGWSPLEPTCSLNVSPERFLQYVVYPVDRDADPTSWSHALPVGRWMHVAVVNNGRRTIVWVDGSKIARNPTQPAHGIATLGRPFVLGATSFDLKYGHGFYGWLGDVRITAKALRPEQFLPAGR